MSLADKQRHMNRNVGRRKRPVSLEHTPLPWKLDEVWMLVKGPKGEEIAAVHAAEDRQGNRAPQGTAHANAEHIVRAVNSYHAMRKALEAVSRWAEGDGAQSDFEWYGQVQRALDPTNEEE